MRNTILAVITACLMAAPVTFAQKQRTGPAHQQASIEMRVQHRVNFLTTTLSLTDMQRQRAKTIFMNAAKTNSMVFGDLRTARHNLRMEVTGGQSAGAIKQVSNTIGNDVGQLVANEASAYQQFYQILSPEQRTKATQLSKEMHDRGMGFGRFNARG